MRTCKVCREKFEPRFNTIQPTCGVPCAIELTNIKKAKAKKAENRKAKRAYYEQDIKWWLRVDTAEASMNGGNTGFWLHKWIRLVRDVDQPCPMCGSSDPRGGQWHACHYRSRGAAKQLRFEPDNIFRGCSHCNTWTEGDTGAKFRAGIVLRIGEARVLELDNDNRIKKWSIEECRDIRDHYKKLCKEAGVK